MTNSRLPKPGDTVKWKNWHDGLIFDKPEWVVKSVSEVTATSCNIWLVDGPDENYGWYFTIHASGNWMLVERSQTMFQIQSDVWPGLAKFVEESSELNVNIAKLIATGGKSEYWGGVDLKKEIEDELADVFAVYLFILANNDLDKDRMTIRTWEKLQKYAEWRANKEG